MAPEVVELSPGSIERASGLMKSGGLIVYPTDTVYGLGCDPFAERAVSKLFEAKRRESKPIPVLCAGEEEALRLVDLEGKALMLAKKHWPGALTIVAPLRRKVPRPLDQGTGTLGVRVPGLGLCRELIRACGGYLVGTSANLSGQSPSRSVEAAVRSLGDSVSLYLDGGPTPGLESTVVKLSGEEIIVLRKGQVGVSAESNWE